MPGLGMVANEFRSKKLDIDNGRPMNLKLHIGAKMKKGLSEKLGKLSEKAKKIFTKVQLFTRGDSEKAISQKKRLSQELQKTVAEMERLVCEQFESLGLSSQEKYREQLALYKKMLSQIRYWTRTGFHRPGKIVHALKKLGVRNCIFRKGKESQPVLGQNTAAKARRERTLSEATIATIKNPRFGFNKPRGKSSRRFVEASLYPMSSMGRLRQ